MILLKSKHHISLLVMTLISVIMYLQVSKEVGLNPDGAYYYDIGNTVFTVGYPATYILHVESASIPDKFLYWPPLFPILLGLLQSFGFSPPLSYVTINFLSYLINNILLISISYKIDGIKLAVITMLIWILLFPRIANIYDIVVSESLFISFLLITIWFFLPPYSAKSLLGAGIATGLATLTRTIGILIIIPALLFIIQQYIQEKKNWNRFLLNIFYYLIPISLLIMPLAIYNFYAGGSVAGLTIPPPGRPLRNSLTYLWHTYFYAFFPLLLIFPFVIINLIKSLFLKRESVFTYILISWIVIYIGTLLYISTYSRINRVGLRLLWPTFPPIMLLVAISIRRFQIKYIILLVIIPAAVSFTNNSYLSDKLLFDHYSWNAVFSFDQSNAPDYYEYQTSLRNIVATVSENFKSDSPIVMKNGWYIRLFTSRPVLTTGYHGMKPLNVHNVCGFAKEHSLDTMAWVVNNSDTNKEDLLPLVSGNVISVGNYQIYQIECP